MCDLYDTLHFMIRTSKAMSVLTYPIYYYTDPDELMINRKVNFYKMTNEHWEQLHSIGGKLMFLDPDQAQKVINILKEKNKC